MHSLHSYREVVGTITNKFISYGAPRGSINTRPLEKVFPFKLGLIADQGN